MGKLKHSRIGLISFGISLSPIICAVLVTIKDIVSPINSGTNDDIRSDLLIMGGVLLIALIGLILGIIAITQKGYKKILPISSVVISSLILLIPIIMILNDITEILSM